MKKPIKMIILIALITATFLLAANVLAADDGTIKITGPIKSPVSGQGAAQIAGSMANIFVFASGAFLLLMFAYGGVLMLISAGDDERRQHGKKALIWSMIGFFLMFLSYSSINLLIYALTRVKAPAYTPAPQPIPPVVVLPQPDDCPSGCIERECDPATEKEQGTCDTSGEGFHCCVPRPETCKGTLADGRTLSCKESCTPSPPYVAYSGPCNPPPCICQTGTCCVKSNSTIGCAAYNTGLYSGGCEEAKITQGEFKGKLSCCDCGSPGSDTPSDWQCNKFQAFIKGDLSISAYDWYRAKYPTKSKALHCGAGTYGTDKLCSDECVDRESLKIRSYFDANNSGCTTESCLLKVLNIAFDTFGGTICGKP